MNQIVAIGVISVAVLLAISCGDHRAEALPFGFLASDQDYAEAEQLRDGLIPVGAGEYGMATPDKRSWRQGPNDECRTYAECRARFVKYLDNLRKMGKVGR
ncbi:uncharacterized protein LOC129588385 [Paramacrobiotus metropolitanus]|uniref:uncharacterized protein LOC129588385 n=1 Tax=Paramacrobiotus metropolitanus TaxID=2943436 RepID=UPI00244631EF|nr:uncharacterized protein LOC129588385 [Paramacrobiotus metropolitanus]